MVFFNKTSVFVVQYKFLYKSLANRNKKIIFQVIVILVFIHHIPMLFNFQTFVAELREKEDKKEIVEKYEKWFGPIQGDVKDQLWYKEYLINFANHSFKVPEELQEEFDRKMLLQLVG